MEKIKPGMLVSWKMGNKRQVGLCIRQHKSVLFVEDYCCEVLTNDGEKKALLASVLREVSGDK